MDEHALERLLEEHDWIRGLARRLAADPAGAEDLAQDTWLKLLQRPPRRSGSLRPWIFAVMANHARNGHRGEQRRRDREDRWATAQVDDVRPADRVDEPEIVGQIRQAVARFDREQRRLLVLRYAQDFSPKEIAEQQGIPAATVRSRIKRALDALRRDLDGSHDGGRAAWTALVVSWLTAEQAAARSVEASPASTTLSPTAGKGLLSLGAWGSLVVVCILGVGASLAHDDREPDRSVGALSTDRSPTSTPALPRLLGTSAATPMDLAADVALEPDPDRDLAAGVADELLLRVEDARTGLALDGVVVYGSVPGTNSARHPGLADRQVVAAGAGERLGIPRHTLEPFHLADTGTAVLYVGAPGFAWERTKVHHAADGLHVIALQPEARMQLDVTRPADFETSSLRLMDEGLLKLRTKIPAGGGPWTQEIAGLVEGEYDLVIRCSHRQAIELVSQPVRLRAGATTRVQLDPPGAPKWPAPVALSGRIRLAAWAVTPALSLELTALAGAALHTDTTPRVLALAHAPRTTVDGVATIPWDMGLTPTGRYAVRVQPYGVLFEEELPAGSPRIIALDLPRLARVQVDLVDRRTGNPARAKKLGWRRAGPFVPGEMARKTSHIRPDDGGRFEIVCAPGEIVLTVATRHSEDGLPRFGNRVHTATEGTTRIEFPLDVLLTLDVHIIENGVVRPVDKPRHRIRVERVDRTPAHIETNFTRKGIARVHPPGLYEVTLEMSGDYLPVPPRRVEVWSEEPTVVEFHVVRSDG